MSETTDNLSLPYILPNQAQKHVTHNEAIRALDALVQLSVVSAALSAPPISPNNGDRYIVPAGGTGDWANNHGDIAAWQDGAWAYYSPQQGWCAYVEDENVLRVYENMSWLTLSGGGGGGGRAKSDPVFLNDTDTSLLEAQGDSPVRLVVDGHEAMVAHQSGRVGFGTANPETGLHVSGTDSATSRLTVERTGSGSGKGIFGSLNGLFVAAQIPVGSARITFWTNPAVDLLRMTLDNDGGLFMEGASGGSKGTGSINAQAVYDDNTLLSCYVFDQAVDGTIDETRWDAKVPDREGADEWDLARGVLLRKGKKTTRRHEPLRKFKNRIKSDHDPLTLDGYARHWREKKHLTSMPNEVGFDPVNDQLTTGEWIQRLVETVEIQAVLIEQLNQRTKGQQPQRRAKTKSP